MTKRESTPRPAIPIAKPMLGQAEINAVQQVLQSGFFVQGPQVQQFEKSFAEYIGVDHAVAVANGTIALDIALKTLKLDSGDQVITSAFSFIASGNCILFQGAQPVFADIDPHTFNLDPEDVAEKVTVKTKAVIPVHLYGQPADMDPLRDLAEDHKLWVVEDAAQAHGAEYKGHKVGGLGDMGCFSLYATKNMTTGEGGILTTQNAEWARRARLLRDHGQTRKYHHTMLGYNYRMTEMCAAIGRIQLQKLDHFNRRRAENAEQLTAGIHTINGLTPPYVADYAKHVFYQYAIRVEKAFPLDRDALATHLRAHQVGVAIHYPSPIYQQPLYRDLGFDKTACPVTEEACTRILSLPVHPAVTKEDVKYVVHTLRTVSQER